VFLSFLFLRISTNLGCSIIESTQHDHVSNHEQQVLLHKLEELVRNLSDIITKLEFKLSDSPQVLAKDEKPTVLRLRGVLPEKGKISYDDNKEEKYVQQEKLIKGKARDEDRARAVSIPKNSLLWSERFQFLSAVMKLHYHPQVLMFYMDVGDEKGRVYLFLRKGDVLSVFYTVCESMITSMVSYLSIYKNESTVVIGHQNGMILVHRVYEKRKCFKNGDDGSPVTILEVHHVGRSRYILSTDLNEKIRVFRENGTVYGSAMPKRSLAFLKQRLLLLTEGAYSLDLRSMKIRESECEGLNHSLIAIGREKLVVLGLEGGYVGMYRSSLPVLKGDSNTMLWTTPVLFFIIVLFVSWQFFSKKKEALTSWGPIDNFNSTSTSLGAPLGYRSGDGSFADSSLRGADIMDLRGGGLRGPSIEYSSPSRYSGGATSSFRPSSIDPISRPTSIDPNYRATSKLKFRALSPTLELQVFLKEREFIH
ncbi:LOW QUALITY PROTEIN: hypothetical protein CFOL_v3_27829, partial [Cephalotus follicularis]